jgi:hypothetical protein
MTFVHPDYWLVYVPEATEDGPPELTALAPAVVDRRTLGRDARITLAVADVFHEDHPDTPIVFVADLTAWLSTQKGTRWADLDVDIYEVMHVFDERVPNVVLSASPIAIAVAIRGLSRSEVLMPGTSVIDAADHDEAVRADILRNITEYLNNLRRSVAHTRR